MIISTANIATGAVYPGLTSLPPPVPVAELVPPPASQVKEAEAAAPDSAQPDETPEEKHATSELTEAEQKTVEYLQQSDQRVRAHEQAHLNTAGELAVSRAQFQYQTGPDRQRYAVSGEVSIDISKVPDDPRATIDKAQHIRRAAMAPADPSAQDHQVANMADAMSLEAQAELIRLQYAIDDESASSMTGQFLDQMA